MKSSPMDQALPSQTRAWILWGISCITHSVEPDRPSGEGKSPDHEEYTLTGATIQIEHRDNYIAIKV